MGRSLRGRYSGVVRYTDELVRALARRRDIDLTVLLTRAADGLDGLHARRVRAPFATPNEYARAFWEQMLVPFQVARLRPSVYHSPNYILPLALSCPTVVTVHDLAFFDPSVHRLRSHLYLSLLTTLSLRKATRIICVSHATRARLVRRFPWLAARVRVIPEGVHDRFTQVATVHVEEFRRRHDLERPYVLFVGTIEPRKNLVRLVGAFGEVLRRTGLPHDLVLVGQRGWKDAPVWAAIASSPARDRIRYLRYVEDRLLPAAYAGASVFVYPSLHEGFGLPPLEAMACGTPVVTSNTTSLPEVVGAAARAIDPLDESALADAIVAVLTDPREHARLAEAGRLRAALFRWDVVAEQTLEVYREAAA